MAPLHSNLIIVLALASTCDAFSSPVVVVGHHINRKHNSSVQLEAVSSRRDIFQKVAFGILAGSVSVGVLGMDGGAPQAALAATEKEPTIWKSGKTPIVPGQKPKDKNDTSGTRKDPSFLRSIATCKNQCENSTGPDGYARSKEECLSDCQDICCTTYEQCTFGIVPRI